MLVFFTNVSLGISGQIFDLISSFLSNKRLWVVLHEKSLQEHPVNAGVSQGSILGPTLFLLYVNDLPDDFICNIAIFADDPSLYSKCDQPSYLWQELELASELEPDLRETLWTGAGSDLLIPVLEKLGWFGLTGLITLVLLMWKWMGLFLRKNHLLKCWGWLSLLNMVRAFTLSLLLKLPPRKFELWFVLLSFLLLWLFHMSINLPYGHSWKTIVMSGLVPLVTT